MPSREEEDEMIKARERQARMAATNLNKVSTFDVGVEPVLTEPGAFGASTTMPSPQPSPRSSTARGGVGARVSRRDHGRRAQQPGTTATASVASSAPRAAMGAAIPQAPPLTDEQIKQREAQFRTSAQMTNVAARRISTLPTALEPESLLGPQYTGAPRMSGASAVPPTAVSSAPRMSDAFTARSSAVPSRTSARMTAGRRISTMPTAMEPEHFMGPQCAAAPLMSDISASSATNSRTIATSSAPLTDEQIKQREAQFRSFVPMTNVAGRRVSAISTAIEPDNFLGPQDTAGPPMHGFSDGGIDRTSTASSPRDISSIREREVNTVAEPTEDQVGPRAICQSESTTKNMIEEEEAIKARERRSRNMTTSAGFAAPQTAGIAVEYAQVTAPPPQVANAISAPAPSRTSFAILEAQTDTKTKHMLSEEEAIKERERSRRNMASVTGNLAVVDLSTNAAPPMARLMSTDSASTAPARVEAQSISSTQTMLQRDADIKAHARGSAAPIAQLGPAVVTGSASVLSAHTRRANNVDADERIKARERRRMNRSNDLNSSSRSDMASSDAGGSNSNLVEGTNQQFGANPASGDLVQSTKHNFGVSPPPVPLQQQQPPPPAYPAAPIGAISVFTNGVVVRRRPAALADQPRGTSVAALYAPTDSQSLGPNSIPEVLMEELAVPPALTSVVLEAKEPEKPPFWKKKTFLVTALVVLVALVGGVGAGVALAGGGGEDDDGGGGIPQAQALPTRAPTSAPTPQIWDPIKVSVSKKYIVTEVGLSTAAALENIRSPQYSAWRWLILDDELSYFDDDESIMTEQDIRTFLTRYVLAVMYHSLEGGEWIRQQGWLNSTLEHCEWEHITCDGLDNIGKIWTGGRPGAAIGGGSIGMRGTVPSEIRYLTTLTHLQLPGNQITNIDAFTEDLAGITVLDLAGNPLGDYSPVLRLTGLATLSLASCNLEGTLHSGVRSLTNLLSLDLRNNDFEGDIAGHVQALPILRDLVISYNRFEGDVMDILADKGDTNRYFLVGSNLLGGSLNASIADFKILALLDLSFNAISGTIPTEIGLMTSLNSISFRKTLLAGTLPSEIGLLTKLTELNLYSAKRLTGTLPAELANMSSLKNLRIPDTSIGGVVSEDFCRLESLERIESNSVLDCNTCELCS